MPFPFGLPFSREAARRKQYLRYANVTPVMLLYTQFVADVQLRHRGS
jgi:hypothetical protein